MITRATVVRIGSVNRIANTDLVDYPVLEDDGEPHDDWKSFVVDSVVSGRKTGDLVLFVPAGSLVPLVGPRSHPWQFLKKRLDYRPGDTHYRIRNVNLGGVRSFGITVGRPLGTFEGDEVGHQCGILEPGFSEGKPQWHPYPILHSDYPGQRTLRYVADWFRVKLGRGLR